MTRLARTRGGRRRLSVMQHALPAGIRQAAEAARGFMPPAEGLALFETAAAYAAVLRAAKTIVFNGPMGVYEKAPYRDGTRTIGEAIAAATAAPDEMPTGMPSNLATSRAVSNAV